MADEADLGPVVGENLRRLRALHGLSLDKLAERSGVSRTMLNQMELGQSAPTCLAGRGFELQHRRFIGERIGHGAQCAAQEHVPFAGAAILLAKGGEARTQSVALVIG